MKNNYPLVSIIIPAYNRAQLIPETLDTIIAQKYQNWECIIVDDGSSDNTREVVKSYIQKDPRFRLFDRPDNFLGGANGARNYGYEVSKGQYIQWFDSDDLMLEAFLSSKMDIFLQHTEYDFIISRFTSFANGKILDRQFQFTEKYKYLFENTLTDKIRTWTPSIIFRKEFLDKTGEKFDETLKWAQEVEFFSRLFIKYQYKYLILDESYCHVRRDNDGAITTDFDKGLSLELKISELKANEGTIRLLLEEEKLTDNLEAYFFKDHKKIIVQSLKVSHNEIASKYVELIDLYLTAKKRHPKLMRFHYGLRLHKAMPVDNLFLHYRLNTLSKAAKQISGKLYRILFERGYLSSKIKKQ